MAPDRLILNSGSWTSSEPFILPGTHTVFPNPFISYPRILLFCTFSFVFIFPTPLPTSSLSENLAFLPHWENWSNQKRTCTGFYVVFALYPAYGPTDSIFLPVTINELTMLPSEVNLPTLKLGIIPLTYLGTREGHLSNNCSSLFCIISTSMYHTYMVISSWKKLSLDPTSPTSSI